MEDEKNKRRGGEKGNEGIREQEEQDEDKGSMNVTEKPSSNEKG